jgi:uncharacterized small protein (DUF1192 family)
MPHEYYSRGSVQRKHDTRATKLDLLKFVSRCREVDVVTVAQNFGLSEVGARCKLWRLTRQSLLETNPEGYGRTKGWRLTRAGWRHLRYLEEAEEYGGGTKGLLVSNLTAEVARLKAENDSRKEIIEDRRGIFQVSVGLVNEKLALEQALATANQEIERLRAENRALRPVIQGRRGR